MIVGAVLGPTALGFYFIGLRIVSIAVDSLTAVVATVSLPTFARLQHDLPRLRHAFNACTRVSGVTCIPMFTALAVLAPALVPLLFGAQWQRSIPIMQVLCGLGIINSVAYFDRSVLLAIRRERSALGITGGQALLNVAIATLTAPYGILAVAVGVTLRQYLFWPVRLWVMKRAVDLDVATYFRQWLTPVLASLAMACAMVAARLGLQETIPLVQVAVCGPLGILVYGVALRFAAPQTLAEISTLLPHRLRTIGRST
jgi:PST family polysaccharide transporter